MRSKHNIYLGSIDQNCCVVTPNSRETGEYDVGTFSGKKRTNVVKTHLSLGTVHMSVVVLCSVVYLQLLGLLWRGSEGLLSAREGGILGGYLVLSGVSRCPFFTCCRPSLCPLLPYGLSSAQIHIVLCLCFFFPSPFPELSSSTLANPLHPLKASYNWEPR